MIAVNDQKISYVRGDISTSVRLETTLSPVRIGSLDPKEELFIGSSAKSTIFVLLMVFYNISESRTDLTIRTRSVLVVWTGNACLSSLRVYSI